MKTSSILTVWFLVYIRGCCMRSQFFVLKAAVYYIVETCKPPAENFLLYLELELSAGHPESSSSELGVVEYRPVPFSSRGRSLFRMGGWSRSGPLGLRLDCSGEEMAEISRGWLMLLTCGSAAESDGGRSFTEKLVSCQIVSNILDPNKGVSD